MFPDEPNAEERQEELPQDNGTPFRPADDSVSDATDDADRQRESAHVTSTHPATDTNIQPEEVYDEGVAGAAEIAEPNAGNAVLGYDPSKDKRIDQEQSAAEQ